jgi:putative hydrolase of the HAD superfamily
MRFIDQFSVLLFDMNGTFMFGEDRFGPGEDFYGTYRALGGRRLAADRVTFIIRACCAGLLRDYEDVTRQDDFPPLAEALREYGGAADEDLELLERVFSTHELGYVPPLHAAFLLRVAETHKVGVVSNICSRPELCAAALGRAGVESLFTCAVFSSAGRSIKPSLAVFRRALAAFPAEDRVSSWETASSAISVQRGRSA